MSYYRFYLFVLLCSLSFSSYTQSMSGLVFDFSFDRQYAQNSVIGWDNKRHPQATQGGRSWTEKELEDFHWWLYQLTQGKQADVINRRLSLLNQWGIAHDCFDTIIALHFVYALQQGLAVKYGQYDSITYAHDPKNLIKQALRHFSTRESNELTYEVDLTTKANFSAGLIYVYASNPGHAVYLSHFIDNGLAQTLEGPFPASFAQIKASYFLRTQREAGNNSATFRRFPLFIRHRNQIITQIPTTYPAVQGNQNQQWWACVQTANQIPEPYQRPLWENIKNFLYANARGLAACQHNLNVDSQTLQASYQQVLQKYLLHVCNSLQERIRRVNLGLKFCLGNDDASCTTDASGLYSTTAFDKRLQEQLQEVSRLLFQAKLDLSQRQALATFQCPTLDLHQDSQQVTYPIQFQLLHIDHDILSFSPWLIQVSQPQRLASHDPRQPRGIRWGCKQAQGYDCISGQRPQTPYKKISDDIQVVYSYAQTGQQQILTINGKILNPEIKHMVFFWTEKNVYRHVDLPTNQYFSQQYDITGWRGTVTVFYFDHLNRVVYQEETLF